MAEFSKINIDENTVGYVRDRHYVSCYTAADVAAKTASLDGFELKAGAEVTVKFDATNTAESPTLNINNTGAKPIKIDGSTVVGTTPATSWNVGQVVGFVYDGTNWKMLGNRVIEEDHFKAGDSYPAPGNAKSIFYAHGWVTGSLKNITADIVLPKPLPSDLTRTFEYTSITARGVSGYLNSSSSITPDSVSVGRRSDYVITLEMSFDTAITNTTNNTPVALYINGVIKFT